MEEEAQEDSDLVYIAIGLMSVFSVVGVIGNALVLYVFSSFKQKLTSTIFILTLATTDFITCLVTIPFTIAFEALKMRVKYDIICKLYFFLMTTTVPFSAFVMVAIAIDRYLCICHPFKHVMTIKRAEYIVACLCVFAVILGVLCSLNYAMFDPNSLDISNMTNNTTDAYNGTTPTYAAALENATTTYQNTTVSRVVSHQLICSPVKGFDDPNSFFYIYQKIYSSFFALCCLIVMILYAMIYRSVLARRRQRMKVVTNQCCGFWNSLPNETEHTEFSTLNNETSFTQKVEEKNNKGVQKNGNDTSISDKDVIIKPGGLSRAKLEKMRMANIKTAFMLSIVTLVFILAFLPSWLVALRVFQMNVVVFYLFFIYHNANPVIYAFMNNAFKTKLKELFTCKRH